MSFLYIIYYAIFWGTITCACALAVHLSLPCGFKFTSLTGMWSFLRPSRVTSRSETRPTGHPQYAGVAARIWMKYCRVPPAFPLVNWIKCHIPIVWTSTGPKDITMKTSLFGCHNLKWYLIQSTEAWSWIRYISFYMADCKIQTDNSLF